MGAQISAIQYYFPEQKLTNDDLAVEFPDYDFSKFEDKVGIAVRYIASKDETALDLAVKACEKLFQDVDRNSIDFVLYCTQSPEYFLPTTACILQHNLSLRRDVGAFDFNLGCSGFTYGVSMAKALISSGQARNVLLVTAETYSKFLHPLDRSNRSIFGDAAAATLISHSDDDKVGNFLFGTDGGGYDKLIVKNGAGRNPLNAEAPLIEYGTNNAYTENHLYMNGPEIYDFTNLSIPPFTEQLLHANNTVKEDVDQYIFHQANAYMLTFMRKKLKIKPEQFYINMKNGGNTVSSTIPIALKDYSTNSKSGVSKSIMLVGFGVGLSWCGGLININNQL